MPSRHHVRSAFVIGFVIGLAIGVVGGALLLTAFGFWAGLMWVLVVTGPLGLWFAAKRQRAVRPTLSFAFGLTTGLAPGALYDWVGRRVLNGNEVWFPLVLAFLLGLTLSPAFNALQRSRSDVAAT